MPRLLPTSRRRLAVPIRAIGPAAGLAVLAGLAGGGAFGAAATAPRIVSVGVGPSGATRVSTLTAKVDAKDPGHRVTLRYRWLRNGAIIANATSRSIDLSRHALRKGDRVRVRVTAVAGGRSATKTSAAMVVADAAPTVTSLGIDPAAPTGADVLSATLRASDADGDRLTERRTWSWTCPGGASGTVIADTIALADLGIGRDCRVSLSDRVSDGTRTTAAAASTTVGDAAPAIASVAVDAQAPATDDTVRAAVAASDPDGDPISLAYQWTLNGMPIAGATGSSLDLSGPGNGDRGDRIAVEVTAGDGTATSSATSPAVTIVNSAPVLDDPAIVYDPATATATIAPGAVDADGDRLQTSVRWTLDGFDAGTAAALDLTRAGAHVGDAIGAWVRVTDSQGASSAWAAPAPATIASGVPAAPPQNDWHPYTELNASPIAAILPVRADPTRVYVLDQLAGFGRSTDAGATWSQVHEGCLTGYRAAYAPSAPDVVYAGCANSGTYRSDDGGASWQAIPITTGSQTWGVGGLAVDPSDADSVFAVCDTCATIWHSTDGGATWQTVGTMPSFGMSVAIDPSDPTHIVVGTGKGVVVSHDGGATWSAASGSGEMIAAFDPDTSALWAIVYQSATASVLRSTDGGATWTTIPGSPTELTTLAPAGGDVYVADKTSDVSRSSDGGTTWSTDTLYTTTGGRGPVDALAVDPADVDHVYVGFDFGGLWGVEFRSDAGQGPALYRTLWLDSVTVTPTTATIDATVPALMPGAAGAIRWEWGIDTTDQSALTPVTGSNADQAASTTLTGLAPDTTYHLIAIGLFNDPFKMYYDGSPPEVTFTTPPA